MHLVFRTTLFILLFTFTTSDVGNQNEPVIKTKNGLIRGVVDKSNEGRVFYSFQGIPFAEPPVGKLRFLEPRKSKSWGGILHADKLPQFCLQRHYKKNVTEGVEDCLYLNVYSPILTAESKENLPVMIYIHGGAYVGGGTSYFLPHILMRENIVLVVIQYRLGVFGFLSTEDDILPGNVGIKDQSMAMKWVQENINSFGGDAKRVTIFGESAGGSSVHIHVLSPGSSGLFHNAIAQSGTVLCPWGKSREHRRLAEKIGDRFNCPLKKGTKHFLKCLQAIDGASILEFLSNCNRLGISPALWTPRADGDVLPEEPEILLREGRFNKVNFISGINREEGAMYFLDIFANKKNLNNLNGDFNLYGPMSMFLYNEDNPVNLASFIYDRYLHGTTVSVENANSAVKVLSERYFIMGHDFATLFHAARGTTTPLYMYELNYKGQYSQLQLYAGMEEMSKEWISHTDELFHLFRLDGPFALVNKTTVSETDLAMSKLLTKMWADFARTGNPTPPGSNDFTWERATVSSFRHLDITLNPKMASFRRPEEMAFWASLKLGENKLMFPEGRINADLDVLRKTTTWLHYFSGSAFLHCLQRSLSSKV